MSYNFTTDKIEVRSMREGKSPRYVVRGTGMVSGLPHVYKFKKQQDGKYKTLKSMFTKNCIDSIKRQSKNKNLFVDAQHELAMNANIKGMLQNKLSPEEIKKVEQMLNVKELPLAKLNDIEINDNSIFLDTELNPSFRQLDRNHEVYFDSVWSSLQNKFINGISANFANAKIVENEAGVEVIDDIDVLGFSYVGSPAQPECSITEVAIRAIQEGEKMVDENEKKPAQETDAMKKELDSTKAELEQLKSDRAKAEAEAKQKSEQEQQKTVEQQKEEQKKIIEDLQKKVDDLSVKKADEEKKSEETNSAKGTVGQQDKYGQEPANKEKGKEFYAENLKEITKDHDETIKTLKEGKSPSIDKSMTGFAELVNLQAKVNNPTAGMTEKDAEYAKEHGLLKKGTGDIAVPRK